MYWRKGINKSQIGKEIKRLLLPHVELYGSKSKYFYFESETHCCRTNSLCGLITHYYQIPLFLIPLFTYAIQSRVSKYVLFHRTTHRLQIGASGSRKFLFHSNFIFSLSINSLMLVGLFPVIFW